MSFFDRFKKTAAPEKKSVSIQTITNLTPGSFLNFALSGSSLTSAQTGEFYRTSAAVATAVDIIADEMEQIVPVLQNPEGEFIDQHEILDLLKKPNEQQEYRAFIGTLSRDWLLNHTSYISAMGNFKHLPSDLWAVRPQQVSPSQDANDFFAAQYNVSAGPGADEYKRTLIKRDALYLSPAEMSELYPILGYSSTVNATQADSPLLAAALDIRQNVNGNLHNAKLLENGGRLSLVAVFKDTLHTDEGKSRKKAIKDQFAGSGNAGGIAVISSEDMELKEMGQKNRDMDYASLQTMSSQAIYKRYKVPLPLISTDASTFNNMGEAVFQLYDRAVLPNFNIIAAGMTQLIMPRLKNMNGWKITYNPESIPSLKTRMLEELKIRNELQLETINEMREFLPNRESIPEGGDVVRQSSMLVPVDQPVDNSVVDENGVQ